MYSAKLCKIAVLVVCFSTLLFSGCGGSAENTETPGTVTITFWHSFVSSTIPALEELIDRFEAENPGIRINPQYIPTGDALVQKLVTSVRSGNAPDVSWIHSHYLEELVKADAVYPMREFIDSENGLTQEEFDDIYPALIQYSSWQGTLYAMPMEATNLGLVYNKDLFREAGLDPEDPPEDWNELREYARRLTLDRDGDGRTERIGFMVPIAPATGPQGTYMMWQFLPFIWQAGGYFVNLEQTRVLFGEQPGVAALTLWKDIYDMQQQRQYSAEPIVAFASGQAAMILDGPWDLPRLPELMRDTDWGVAMLPAGPEKRATVVAGEYLAIFKQTKNPDAAWTFIKWILQPEIQAYWSMKSGYLPVRASALDVPEFRQYLSENPPHKAFVDQMEYAQAQRSLDFHTLEIQRHLADAIEKATVGGQDPATVLQAAADRSNALLTQVAKR